MQFRILAIGLALSATLGCGSPATPSEPAPSEPAGHSLTLKATLSHQNGEAGFITTSGAVIRVPVAEIVGKPYLVATFPAGFSSGNDAPLHQTWGRVPASLAVATTTPATLKDGAYDVFFVLYVNTPISEEVMKGAAQFAPAAVKGDLASFSIDTSAVREGDPKVALGGLRVNVAGNNPAVSVENRTPANPADSAQIGASFVNTVMVIP